MNKTVEPEIIGTAPDLALRRCDELLLEQYWHQGQLAEPANAVYLRFGAEWYRLCLDCGVVFWRTQEEPGTAYSMRELQAEVRLDDFGRRTGIAGHTLLSYCTSSVPDGSQVEFRFSEGRSVAFRDVGDHTSVVL